MHSMYLTKTTNKHKKETHSKRKIKVINEVKGKRDVHDQKTKGNSK